MKWHQLQKSPTKYPQMQCSRESNQLLQGSLYCHPVWSRQGFSHAVVGLFVTPGRAYIKHVKANKHCTNNLCLCIHAQPTQLQQDALCTPGMQCYCTKNQMCAKHVTHMQQKNFTLGHHGNITDAIK